LFQQLNEAHINELIIDGSITGGDNSRYVGAIAGNIYRSTISMCLNMADVTGPCYFSSVGGITGEIQRSTINTTANIGTITGR